MCNQYSRKYPKVTGWWVYVIKTPDNMYYPGYGGGKKGTEQLCERWKPNRYNRITLQSYIEEFGWDNLEKIMLIDGLTKEEAKQWEDRLICMYRQLGCCINKNRSGYIAKDDKYMKQYYQDHKEELLEKKKQYYQDHREERIKYQNNYLEKKF